MSKGYLHCEKKQLRSHVVTGDAHQYQGWTATSAQTLTTGCVLKLDGLNRVVMVAGYTARDCSNAHLLSV